MATRHFGFALSSHFGPLRLFYAASLAGTYSFITVALYDGELSGVAVERARCLGRAAVKLFENTPRMPTLRDMHRIVAAHPTIQARLFLLLEGVLLTEMLCVQDASIGEVLLDPFSECHAATLHFLRRRLRIQR